MTLRLERLHELLAYDQATGVFTQRIQYLGRQGARWKAGRVAGCVNKLTGYLTLRLDGKLYQAHRLAWLYVHGTWPTAEIDHRDGDRLNNAMSNLRDVSRRENAENMRHARADSATGVQGASPYKKTGRFQALVRHEGRCHYLGTYDTVAEARAVYVDAKAKMHAAWVPPNVGEQSTPAVVPPKGCMRVRCDSKSGLQGVQRSGKKWRARLLGKYLGVFDTAEAAHAAFVIAKNR